MGSAGGGPGSHAPRTPAHKIATAATRPRLIPSGLTLAARIRAAGEGSIRLDRDRLRASGDLSPISQHRDLMSLRRDGAADGLGITALHLQCAPASWYQRGSSIACCTSMPKSMRPTASWKFVWTCA